jgi:hypothetical protein
VIERVWQTAARVVQLDAGSVTLIASLSLSVFVLGLVLMPVLVARIPANYFVGNHKPLERLGQRSPLLRWGVLLLKNALGSVLLVAGVLMLVLPGQGILTLLVGLTLVDFPGKRKFELWLVRRGPVLRAIAWIRTRAGRAPLLVPSDERP